MKPTLLLFGIIALAGCEQKNCIEDQQVHISISKDKEGRIGWETTYVKKLTDTLQYLTLTLPRLPMPNPAPISDSGAGSPRDTLLVRISTGKLIKKDDDDND